MEVFQQLRIQPYDYQAEGIKRIESSKYAIIADSMGLGKTLQGLAQAFIHVNRGDGPVLVVCPSYLKRNWTNEIYKFSTNQNYTCSILDSNRDVSDPPSDSDFYIIGYSMLSSAKELFKRCKYIIADEAHYLKNHTSVRTKTFVEYIEDHPPDYLVLLTGTPIRNGVVDYFPLLYLMGLCPSNTNGIRVQSMFKNIYKFLQTFCYKEFVHYGRGRKCRYYGIRNVDKLKVLLKHKYIRRLAENVLDLPPCIEKEIFVDYMSATGDGDLRKCWEQYNITNKIDGHVMQIKREVAIAKAGFSIKYVNGLLDEGYGPIVLYSDHPDAAKKVMDGIIGESRLVTGKTPMIEREQIIADFQEGGIDCICASIRSFSEGINLTKATNLVFNDISWVPAYNEQATKRIHRIGQEKKTIIHYILGSRIDKVILLNNKAKRNIVSKLESA